VPAIETKKAGTTYSSIISHFTPLTVIPRDCNPNMQVHDMDLFTSMQAIHISIQWLRHKITT
jgi:hypothetical protein